MDNHFRIEHTQANDLPSIYDFFSHSIDYQRKKGYPVWDNYDKGAVEKDVKEGNHYKIVTGSQIAIAFSVCYHDKLIWRDRDKNDSVFLHRIVVNPEFKGRKLFGIILKWAISHAQSKDLQFVRMDTWANNKTITDYYLSFGFRFVENYTTGNDDKLPVHNRNLGLSLLEFRIEE